jgi:hypothetical protein
MSPPRKRKNSTESVASPLRPVAKAIVKAGLVAYDKVIETVSQANTQLADFVQEARGERGKAEGLEKKPPGASKQRRTTPKERKSIGSGHRSKGAKR